MTTLYHTFSRQIFCGLKNQGTEGRDGEGFT
jgi:hypothetical protein